MGMSVVKTIVNGTKQMSIPDRTDRIKSVYVNFLVITGYVIPIIIILYSYGQILYQLLMNKSIRDVSFLYVHNLSRSEPLRWVV